MGTNEAYLNVRTKEVSETLLLNFSKQTKHDGDAGLGEELLVQHVCLNRTRLHKNSPPLFTFPATEKSLGKLGGWHSEKRPSAFLFIYLFFQPKSVDLTVLSSQRSCSALIHTPDAI